MHPSQNMWSQGRITGLEMVSKQTGQSMVFPSLPPPPPPTFSWISEGVAYLPCSYTNKRSNKRSQIDEFLRDKMGDENQV